MCLHVQGGWGRGGCLLENVLLHLASFCFSCKEKRNKRGLEAFRASAFLGSWSCLGPGWYYESGVYMFSFWIKWGFEEADFVLICFLT